MLVDSDMKIIELSKALQAVGDPNRLRIIRCLVNGGALCVCEIGDALGLAQSTLSTHLQVLRSSGLVNTRRQHKWIEYEVSAEWKGWVSELVGRIDRDGDLQLGEDDVRLKARLRLRDDGCCTSGFGALEDHLKEVLSMSDKNCCDCGCCTSCECGKCKC